MHSHWLPIGKAPFLSFRLQVILSSQIYVIEWNGTRKIGVGIENKTDKIIPNGSERRERVRELERM